MGRARRRAGTALLTAVTTVILVCACGSEGSSDVASTSGPEVERLLVPSGESPGYRGGSGSTQAATVVDGKLFLMFRGSSTCPPEAEAGEVTVQDGVITGVALEQAEPQLEGCTFDQVPHHYQLSTERVVAERVRVLLDGRELPVVEVERASVLLDDAEPLGVE